MGQTAPCSIYPYPFGRVERRHLLQGSRQRRLLSSPMCAISTVTLFSQCWSGTPSLLSRFTIDARLGVAVEELQLVLILTQVPDRAVG